MSKKIKKINMFLFFCVVILLAQMVIAQKSQLSLSQATDTLAKILNGKSVLAGDLRSTIQSVEFSPCTMTLSLTVTNSKRAGSQLSYDYKADFRAFRETRFGRHPQLAGVALTQLFFNGNVIQAQKLTTGSVTTAVDMIGLFSSSEDDALLVSNLFDIVGDGCKKEKSESSESGPSLRETTDWITNKINKTEVVTTFRGHSVFTKYLEVRFSEAKLTLRKLTTIEEVRTTYDYYIPLESLRTVKVGSNESDEWAVTLEFGQNFEVNSETVVGVERTKESERTNTLRIESKSREDARRIGTAFVRALELCAKVTREPF